MRGNDGTVNRAPVIDTVTLFPAALVVASASQVAASAPP